MLLVLLLAAQASGADLCSNPACHCGAVCGSCWCDTPAHCAKYGNCCPDHLAVCDGNLACKAAAGYYYNGAERMELTCGESSANGTAAIRIVGNGSSPVWAGMFHQLNATQATVAGHVPFYRQERTGSVTASGIAWSSGVEWTRKAPPPAPGQPGYLVWKIPHSAATSGGSIDNASPASVDGIVVFSDAVSSTVYALDEATGVEKWKWANASGYAGRFTSVAAYSCGSASSCNSACVFVKGSTLISLDLATGARNFAVTLPGATSSGAQGPPVVSIVHAPPKVTISVFVALGGGGGTHAVDARTGAVQWSTRNVSASATSPSVGLGKVFVATEAGSLACLDASSGAVLWIERGRTNQWASPILSRKLNLVYSASGSNLIATNVSNGAIRWTIVTALYNPLAPALDDENGRLFLAGTTTTVFAFDAVTGHALWVSPSLCPTHLWSVPFLASKQGEDQVVFVGSDTNAQLHALDAATGAVLWTFTAPDGNAVRSPIVTLGDLVVVGTNSPWGPGSSGSTYAVQAWAV